MVRRRKRVRSRTARLRSGDHRVRSLRGGAEQPGGQPVGERVLRRLEAALDPFRDGPLAGSDP